MTRQTSHSTAKKRRDTVKASTPPGASHKRESERESSSSSSSSPSLSLSLFDPYPQVRRTFEVDPTEGLLSAAIVATCLGILIFGAIAAIVWGWVL